MAGLSGKTLGGFRILEQIQDEESAQGIVCKAICEAENPNVSVSKGQVVALKVMPVRDDNRRQQWRKLENRTKELAQLNHPNIVRYYGCFCEQGEWNQLHVIVQEYLEGETLKERLKRFPAGLDVDEGLKIIDFALDGLAHTASKGIVHRDIKPGNIFICEEYADGKKQLTVKLIDFEIAKQGHGSTTASTGNLRGSFNYMAPEFLDAKFRGDLLSDVFSMGVTLHETLTGKLPYNLIDGNGEDAILDFVARWKSLSDGKNPVLISADINRLLAHTDKLFLGCLSPAREQRFSSFEDFRAAIKNVRFRTLTNPESGSAYQMLQFIGKGGFGEVFKARESKTGQIVAIKHLRKAKYADRFKREAKILAKFDDKCFVRFVESFSRELDGRVQEFLVMGFLDGMPGNSLWDAIKKSNGAGLPVKDVFTAFIRYAHGLKMLHMAGIFHRDIKPSNLYFPAGRPESAAIMDLGIARDTKGTMTVGSVPGTPDYMPPEVVTAGSRGESGMDVYALGLCMYEALTAKTAFARLPSDIEGFKKLVERVNSKAQPRFDDGRIDADVFDLLTDMTAFNPGYRIKDVEDVERRLREFLAKIGSPDVDPLSPPDPVPAPGGGWLKKCLVWGGVLIASIAVVGGALTFACPWAKRAYAERELESVLEAYRKLAPGATDKENAWIVEFNPQSYSWLRLDSRHFASCTNAIYAVKQQTRADKLRGDCLSRLGNCLSNNGKLNLENYAELNEWRLPTELDGDDRIADKLSEIGRSVMSELNACVAIGDIKNRRKRLKVAKDILENRWTLKVLDAGELRRMKKAVDDATDLCVGSVHNGCKDAITVCGERIVANETRTIIVKDGRPERQLVTRAGYKPIPLPTGFDGMSFEVDDSSFVIKPIKFSMPKFSEGIRFFLKNNEYSGGENVELEPGSYIARYVRDDKMPNGEKMYKDYLVEFSVTANADVKIPDPGNWEKTEQYAKYLSSPVFVEIPGLDEDVVCRIDGTEAKGKVKIVPGKHHCVYEKKDYLSQTNSFGVIPGRAMSLSGPRTWKPTEDLKKLRDAVKLAEQKSWAAVDEAIQGVTVVAPENVKELKSLGVKVSAWKQQEADRIRKEKEAAEQKLAVERKEVKDEFENLLALEPITGRRDRIEKAKKLLQAEKTRLIFAKNEIDEWKSRVQEEAHWVVGRIKNDCDFGFSVGDIAISPDESRVIKYDDRQSQGVIVRARGYVDRKVAKELDGTDLVISGGQWTMSDVLVKIEGATKGVKCVFNGEQVNGEFKVKPGNYSLVFKRDGYESQSFDFFAKLYDGCTVAVPREWSPLPVDVSVPVLDDDVKCYLGASQVSKSVRLTPGKSYEFRYQKDDCEDQRVMVLVEVGTPAVVPGPSVWVDVAAVKSLGIAEQLIPEGKLDEAAKKVEGVRFKSSRNVERLRVVKDKIKKAAALKESVSLAQGAILQEDWYECIRYYYIAKENGYVLNAADRANVETEFAKGMEELKAMLKKALHDINVGRTPIRDPDAIRKDMRQLNEWYAAIRK